MSKQSQETLLSVKILLNDSQPPCFNLNFICLMYHSVETKNSDRKNSLVPLG